MDQYGTEEEQVEALKRWWDENGKLTIAAVVIALSTGFGWRAFQDYQVTQADLASESSLVLRAGKKKYHIVWFR